jgi:hypothetical protein
MKQSYLVQRLHPNLRIGFAPSVLHGQRLMPIHCQQGWWDSACGAHCAAIAMALLGEIHDVAVLSERRNGAAARLWKAARRKYFDGVTVEELAAMIDDMGTERKITTCTERHGKCLDFALANLARGNLVIVSWHSRRGQQHHWSTVVGVEGRQAGRDFTPSVLLCLDPGVDEPMLCGYNSRLEFTIHPSPRSPRYVLYRCADGSKLAVTLTSALAIGESR